MKKILLGASALLFAASLLSFNTSSQGDAVAANDAVVRGGTCCPGTGTCYPPNQEPVSGWWRSDGRPCKADFADPVPVQN